MDERVYIAANGARAVFKNLFKFHMGAYSWDLELLDRGLIDVCTGELAQFHALLSEDALLIGEPYSRQRESRVWFALDLLFRSQGRPTGVSRTLNLNYDKKTATVAYKIWEGPPGEPKNSPRRIHPRVG